MPHFAPGIWTIGIFFVVFSLIMSAVFLLKSNDLKEDSFDSFKSEEISFPKFKFWNIIMI